MADHMRRNDKLQNLTASAARASARRQLDVPGEDRFQDIAQDERQVPVQDQVAPSWQRRVSDDAPVQVEGQRRNRVQGRSRAQAGRHQRGRAAAQSQVRRQSRMPSRSQEEPQVQGQSLASFAKRNATYILSVVAVIVLAVITILFLRMCAPTDRGQVMDGDVVIEEEGQRYATPYDWTKLDRSNGRYAYVVDGQVKSRLGIDVSESQESIDWQAVADDGIEFAMIRLGYRGATEGDLYLDDYFEENFAGAREAGLDCGVYFFSQAVNPDEAVEEAQFVLDQLGGAQLEYPIAFDSEVVSGVAGARTQFLTREEMTAVADAFCTHLEMAGYRTLVYGNAGDLSRYSDEVVNDGGIWWAEYNAPQPAHYLDIVMWQYANEGSVAGIGTGVDMNIDLSGVL